MRSYDATTGSGTVMLDDGIELPYDSAAVTAGGMRGLRMGQRVRIETSGSGADTRVTFLVLATLADPRAARP